MSRGQKKATGCSTWAILLIAVIGLIRMFSTRREAPPARPVVPAPVAQAPRAGGGCFASVTSTYQVRRNRARK